MHGPRWPLRNPNDGTRPPSRRWRKAARCAVAVGATRELPVRRRRFCADTGLRATRFASVASALLRVSDELPDAQRVLPAEPGSRGVSAFTITRFGRRYVDAHQIYRFRWRGASGESAYARQGLRSFWRPREQPQRRARLHLATRFPAPIALAPPAEAGGPESDRRSSCSTYLDPFQVCTSHPLPQTPPPPNDLAGVPRAGLPSGARLPGPSAPAAGWAGPMHGPRWPLRNPNDGTRPPPRRWRKAARCAVVVGATRELPVRRSRFCVDTGLRATTFASVASALLCVSDEPPDAQRARRLGPGRSLLSLPNRVGCEGASRRRVVNRQSQPRWAARVLPAEPGSRGVSAFTIACFRWRYVHAHQIYRFRWRAPPERAPPPCKRSGVSGGPASSPNVVPAFTLPPGSPLSIAPALPLKQEAPSPIGAPRAAPTSIPSRCAHRTLSPKRLRRPTLCRCAAGRAAARSAAARTVGTSGGLGGPDARPQVAIAEPQ